MSGFPLNALISNPGSVLCPTNPSCGCSGSCSGSCQSAQPCGVPGNGLGSFVAGQNPFPVVATQALQDYRAVAITVGGLKYASNDTPADQNALIGIIGAGANSGAQGWVTWGGPVTNPINGSGGWNWTLGTPVYLGTNGQLTQTPPAANAGFTRIIGVPMSANTILVFPQVPNSMAPLPRVTAPAFSTSMTIDGASTDVANILLTGNSTITLVGAFDGQQIDVRLTQDAVGGRTVTFNGVDYGTGSAPTLSVTALLVDKLTFEYVASIGAFTLVRQVIGLTV